MKIFCKDSEGNIRYLDITCNSKGELIRVHGLVGTENPVEDIKQCKGKNLGKKNETTPAIQALKEMEAIIEVKLREGYFEKMADAINKEVILPMLAKDYKKESKKIDWNGQVYVQRKYDGMRCLAFIVDGTVKLMSRDNVEITTMNHIVKEIEALKLDDIILDGELFMEENFQANMKAIKSYKEGISEKIEYHIYDIVSEKLFTERTKLIKELIPSKAKHLKIVSTYKIKSEQTLRDYHKKFIEEGFEGSMLRIDQPYKVNARSSGLLKYKDFKDIALEIIDIVPCDVKTSWGKPVFELNGKRFESGMKYSHAEREEFLVNKSNYIGKVAEVRFFEYSDNGIPRFPVMYGIRIDKTKSDKIKTKELC